MAVLVVLVGLVLPRFAIILLAIFTDWFSTAFDHWVIPLLGFFFLPYTLLWYSAVINWFDGAWDLWQVIFLALALVADMSSSASRFRQN